MHTEKFIEEYLNECEQEIARIEEIIAALPPGKLHISKNGGYYTWRVLLSDGTRIYLPKSEEKTAKLLAQKNIYLARLHDLNCQAQACRKYIRCLQKTPSFEQKLFSGSNPEFSRLAADKFRFDDQNIIDWQNKPYDKFTSYPEQLTIPTLKEGEKVRSKLEAIVASQLVTLKIPYKYEKITLIGSTKIAVDFTAFDARCGREIPIEIFGMMDNPDYIKSCRRKLSTYIYAGYYPGVNFITFYESPETPLNPRFINKTLEDFFFRNPPQMV